MSVMLPVVPTEPNITYVANAGHATTANSATTASTATNATNATNANYATRAGTISSLQNNFIIREVNYRYSISRFEDSGTVSISYSGYTPIGVVGVKTDNAFILAKDYYIADEKLQTRIVSVQGLIYVAASVGSWDDRSGTAIFSILYVKNT